MELFISLGKLRAPLTVLLKKREKESNIHERHEKGPSLTAHCWACWEGWILNLYRIKNCKEQQCQYLAGSPFNCMNPCIFSFSATPKSSSPGDCERSAGSEKASHTPKVTQQQTADVLSQKWVKLAPPPRALSIAEALVACIPI